MSGSRGTWALGGDTEGRVSHVLVLLALWVGWALRLAYALHASPYIDEFTTIWAAQRVLESGWPQFPSGAIYTQGLIFTYLDAAVLALDGAFDPFLARLPSLALSMATLALSVYAARWLFQSRLVGLAALWLALDSQAVIWGGRARTYALLQFLVLAAFLAWQRGAVEADRPGPRWVAIGLLLAALVDQPLVLLLLPPLALLALAARGWGWLRQPVVWLQAGVVVVGLVVRWFLYGLMVPAGAVATSEPRAFVDPLHPFAGLGQLSSFVSAPNRLIPALLIVGGGLWLLFRRHSGSQPRRQSFLSLLFLLLAVGLEVLLLVGVSWREPRYLYPLLPLFFLAAEGVAVPLLRRLARPGSREFRWALPLLSAVFVAWIGWRAWPSAQAVAARDEWGYDRALEVVAESWAEGDALATIAPAAAFASLGHCDYLALEEGGQTLLLEREGQQVDGWTALPVLDAPARLEEALAHHQRLWFVADEMRLNRHFSTEYLRLLWDRFDLLAFEGGVFVFLSRPAEAPPAVERSIEYDFGGGPLLLERVALSDDSPPPGGTITVTLYWRSGKPGAGTYTAFVHLVDRAGQGLAGHDAPPLGGLYPVQRWPRSERSQPFPDRRPLTLPADLPPGRYRLEAGLYDSATLEPLGERVTLDFVAVGGYEEQLPPLEPVARFDDAVSLYLDGLEGEFRPGGKANLSLAWQVGPAGLEDDFTVFLHLLDAEGQIAQQFDAPPTGGWYPTSYWKPGEVVYDAHGLDFSPMLVPGSYRLVAGLYRADGSRLPLNGGADSVDLARIELQP